MITSTTNIKIKNIIQLFKSNKARREQNSFVIEGVKMFMEAPSKRIKEVYISEGLINRINCGESLTTADSGEIKKKLEETGYEVVSEQVFKKMSETMTPQGILCVVDRINLSVRDLIMEYKNKPLHVLVLENIQDPGNLGTMIRTAEGAGYDFILASDGTVDMYNPKVIRSTMGSIYRVPVVYSKYFHSDIEELKEAGVIVYAAHLEGINSYRDEKYGDRVAIMIGNEANGLKDDTANRADKYVKIPMEGKVESLNAAVAAAVLMFSTKE